MKKLLLFIIVLILSQCQISIGTKEVNAQNSYRIEDNNDYTVESFTKTMDGMNYRIFTYEALHNGYPAGGVFVVNVTKEKLEVEKLKLEIKKLKE